VPASAGLEDLVHNLGDRASIGRNSRREMASVGLLSVSSRRAVGIFS
jgi:hypothetical protein